MFKHQTIQNQVLDLPLGKVVCVGRNYAEHAKELGNEIPEAPILFIKPATSVVPLEGGFAIPADQGSVHHEIEITLLIGKKATDISVEQAWDHVSHVGLALDLTLRDVQSQLKAKSLPWEIAKGFDGACPLSSWVAVDRLRDVKAIDLELIADGQIKQQGNSQQMITTIPNLLAYISQHFTLMPGDVILTGTPAGVGPLNSKEQLTLILDQQFIFNTEVL